MQNNRIYSLDYLRGLTALSIMVFHFTSWTFQPYAAEDFLGRIGLYGVSVFYVLSGLTLFLIYHHTLKPSIASLGNFALKRIFRILPLLWLTVAGTLILNPKLFDWRLLFLSLTGLFGFVEPTGGLGTGLWSIGNELVFYAFFPGLMLLLQRNRYLFLGACALLVAISLYVGFAVMEAHQPLSEQWHQYVNPFNQIILFAGGLLLGYFNRNAPAKNRAGIFSHPGSPVFLLLAALLLFTFYPVSGDRIGLVTGFTRLLFIGLSLTICLAFFRIHFKLPAFIHQPLAITGEISYGLYLLHPLVYGVIFGAFKVLNWPVAPWLILLLALAATFLASYLVFRFYEKPFIRLGKKLSLKLFV